MGVGSPLAHGAALTLLLFPLPQLSPGSEDDEGHEGVSRENLGRIQFSVGYNFQESTLTVKIMKAQELPAKDFSGTSDPFVKIYLLPDKKHKLETKVKRKNLNPHWNETFLFEGMDWDGLEGIRVGVEPCGTVLGLSSAQATRVVAVGDAMGWPSHSGQAGCASHKGDVGEGLEGSVSPWVDADVGTNVAAAPCAAGCSLSSASCQALATRTRRMEQSLNCSSSPLAFPPPAQGFPTRRWCSGCCTSRSWTMTASAAMIPLERCPSHSTRWT